MSSINVRVPDDQKKEIEETAERENYPSPSEWVREAIREKLRRETKLYPREVERILEVWEKEKNGELETTPAGEVWEELGVEE
ncbi:MAG: ribbon-helix-helix domain-containing protein [Candidatus Nanohaloarchaea archaeon]